MQILLDINCSVCYVQQVNSNFFGYATLDFDDVLLFKSCRFDHFIVTSKRILGRRLGCDPLLDLTMLSFPRVEIFNSEELSKMNAYVDDILLMIKECNEQKIGCSALARNPDQFFRSKKHQVAFAQYFLFSLDNKKAEIKKSGLKLTYGRSALSEKELRAVATCYLVDIIFEHLCAARQRKSDRQRKAEVATYFELAFDLHKILINSEDQFDQIRKGLIGAEIYGLQHSIIKKVVSENPDSKTGTLREMSKKQMQKKGIAILEDKTIDNYVRKLRALLNK